MLPVLGYTVPYLKAKPSEHVAGGRCFVSFEADEALLPAFASVIGEDHLVYASDYPHGESWFPESTSAVMGWGWDPDRLRKLLWDNPVRLYARYEANVAERSSFLGEGMRMISKPFALDVLATTLQEMLNP